eukprot:GHVT01077430.1.p1 GENE.GHVT01077430.1~~GHVT01077430.1.p1  ORF type:complete len:249 (+),score=32.61 GHVT01077430.1:278-1024(+)
MRLQWNCDEEGGLLEEIIFMGPGSIQSEDVKVAGGRQSHVGQRPLVMRLYFEGGLARLRMDVGLDENAADETKTLVVARPRLRRVGGAGGNLQGQHQRFIHSRRWNADAGVNDFDAHGGSARNCSSGKVNHNIETLALQFQLGLFWRPLALLALGARHPSSRPRIRKRFIRTRRCRNLAQNAPKRRPAKPHKRLSAAVSRSFLKRPISGGAASEEAALAPIPHPDRALGGTERTRVRADSVLGKSSCK